MLRKGEYHDGRRVFGTNNKLKPLVGKSPASAGMAPMNNNVPPVNSSNMNSNTLLQGSGYYSKGPTKKANPAPRMASTKPVESSPKEEVIVIHVWDEKKKLEKDFRWPK